jgi:signal transduction histidine kinase
VLISRPNHRLVFASAIFLLIVCGVASAWTLSRIFIAEKWVRHTYDVQIQVADIEASLAKAGRARQAYLQTGESHNLQAIEEARTEVFSELSRLKEMVRDNLDQQKNSEELEQVATGRLQIVDESLQLLNSGKSTREAQDTYTGEMVRWSQRTSTIATSIKDVESILLEHRLVLTNSLFTSIIVISAGTFLLSLYMLWEHYRGLNRELAKRKLAERNALNLGLQLLNAQDQERRKIARDLHDGLGQNLAAAKMIADSFLHRPPEKQRMQELSAILDDAVSSTRSISHLLHPPLVEELGFSGAARSYLKGFSSRTGVEVQSDIPDSQDRLPAELELTLFRVLQEALTNIQRHSKSTNAQVEFRVNGRTATLKVRDNGIGLAPEMFRNFHKNGASVGVGLAGMRERVRERNGHFEIRSDSKGTAISATIPIASENSPSD